MEWLMSIDEFVKADDVIVPHIVPNVVPGFIPPALASAELAMERAAESAAAFAERIHAEPKSGPAKHSMVRRRLEGLAKLYEPKVAEAIALLIPYLIEQAVLRLRRT